MHLGNLKCLSLSDDAIRELHIVRCTIKTRPAERPEAASKYLVADLKDLWVDFIRQYDAVIESTFDHVPCAVSDSRILRSGLDVVDDFDLSTVTVVLDDVHDDVFIIRHSIAAAIGGSGDGVDDDAMSQYGNDDNMSQHV